MFFRSASPFGTNRCLRSGHVRLALACSAWVALPIVAIMWLLCHSAAGRGRVKHLQASCDPIKVVATFQVPDCQASWCIDYPDARCSTPLDVCIPSTSSTSSAFLRKARAIFSPGSQVGLKSGRQFARAESSGYRHCRQSRQRQALQMVMRLPARLLVVQAQQAPSHLPPHLHPHQVGPE